MNELSENTIYTTGYIDNDGRIAVPGVYLEDGAKVKLAIKVKPGRFEVAMFPNDEDEESESRNYDCGISEEEIERTCAMHDDCGDCPLSDYCDEETEAYS